MAAGVRGFYDRDLQMWCEEPYENIYYMKFYRWLAEKGELEHPVLGDSVGKYSQPSSMAAFDTEVDRTVDIPPKNWKPFRYLQCYCTFSGDDVKNLIPVPRCKTGRNLYRELREATYYMLEGKELFQEERGAVEQAQLFKRYWEHFGRV